MKPLQRGRGVGAGMIMTEEPDRDPPLSWVINPFPKWEVVLVAPPGPRVIEPLPNGEVV